MATRSVAASTEQHDSLLAGIEQGSCSRRLPSIAAAT